jgi:response regulator of the lytR/algR family
MKNMSSIDMAKSIRLIDKYCFLFFLTISNGFAQESYEINSFSYILKPINPDKIFNTLNRIDKTLKQNTKALHFTANGNSTIKLCIPFNKIMYIDIINKTICIHMHDNTVEIAETFTNTTCG